MTGSLPILMYHKIEVLKPGAQVPGHYVAGSVFHSQMAILRRLNYHPITLTNALEGPLPPRPIVLTFHHGYRNFITNALPILKRFDFPSTVFLVADEIGGENSWDVRTGDIP